MDVSEYDLTEVWDAIRGELKYQDELKRRTSDEAKDPAGFLTLLDVYIRKGQEDWAMNAGPELALHDLRKIAAIAVRGMIYCGVRER